MALDIAPSNTGDLPAIVRILEAAGLTADGLDGDGVRIMVARDSGTIVGTAAVERLGATGLLRSVAVAPAHRGSGVGSTLVRAVEADTLKAGISVLYLLTEDADRFFSRLGYTAASRADIPPSVRATRQYEILCPESAVVMHRTLEHEAKPIG